MTVGFIATAFVFLTIGALCACALEESFHRRREESLGACANDWRKRANQLRRELDEQRAVMLARGSREIDLLSPEVDAAAAALDPTASAGPADRS